MKTKQYRDSMKEYKLHCRLHKQMVIKIRKADIEEQIAIALKKLINILDKLQRRVER